MKLTNNLIYTTNQLINSEFINCKSYIPAKTNFIIQKNFIIIQKAWEEIENIKTSIITHYGIPNNENNLEYIIPKEKISEASRELEELFDIEQELDIKTIKIEDLGDIQLTPAQMQALMFMIED